MTLEWAGARLRCCLPPAGMRAWLSARMPDLDLDELPEPLYAAAVEALVDGCWTPPARWATGPRGWWTWRWTATRRPAWSMNGRCACAMPSRA